MYCTRQYYETQAFFVYEMIAKWYRRLNLCRTSFMAYARWRVAASQRCIILVRLVPVAVNV
jgi:hypothetical protein